MGGFMRIMTYLKMLLSLLSGLQWRWCIDVVRRKIACFFAMFADFKGSRPILLGHLYAYWNGIIQGVSKIFSRPLLHCVLCMDANFLREIAADCSINISLIGKHEGLLYLSLCDLDGVSLMGALSPSLDKLKKWHRLRPKCSIYLLINFISDKNNLNNSMESTLKHLLSFLGALKILKMRLRLSVKLFVGDNMGYISGHGEEKNHIIEIHEEINKTIFAVQRKLVCMRDKNTDSWKTQVLLQHFSMPPKDLIYKHQIDCLKGRHSSKDMINKALYLNDLTHIMQSVDVFLAAIFDACYKQRIALRRCLQNYTRFFPQRDTVPTIRSLPLSGCGKVDAQHGSALASHEAGENFALSLIGEGLQQSRKLICRAYLSKYKKLAIMVLACCFFSVPIHLLRLKIRQQVLTRDLEHQVASLSHRATSMPGGYNPQEWSAWVAWDDKIQQDGTIYGSYQASIEQQYRNFLHLVETPLLYEPLVSLWREKISLYMQSLSIKKLSLQQYMHFVGLARQYFMLRYIDGSHFVRHAAWLLGQVRAKVAAQVSQRGSDSLISYARLRHIMMILTPKFYYQKNQDRATTVFEKKLILQLQSSAWDNVTLLHSKADRLAMIRLACALDQSALLSEVGDIRHLWAKTSLLRAKSALLKINFPDYLDHHPLATLPKLVYLNDILRANTLQKNSTLGAHNKSQSGLIEGIKASLDQVRLQNIYAQQFHYNWLTFVASWQLKNTDKTQHVAHTLAVLAQPDSSFFNAISLAMTQLHRTFTATNNERMDKLLWYKTVPALVHRLQHGIFHQHVHQYKVVNKDAKQQLPAVQRQQQLLKLYRQDLIALSNQLQKVENNSNSSVAALRYLQQTVSMHKSTALAQLIRMTESIIKLEPTPDVRPVLRHVLRLPLRYVWQHLAQLARQSIQRDWWQSIYKPFQAQIGHDYPCCVDAVEDADPNLFSYWLLTKSTGITSFFQHNLLFFTRFAADSTLHNISFHGFSLGLNNESLERLSKVMQLAGALRKTTANNPYVFPLAIAAVPSAYLSQLVIRFPGSVFIYNNGPIYWQYMNLAFSNFHAYTSISVERASGSRIILQHNSGHWAVLHLLHSAHWQCQPNSIVCRLSWALSRDYKHSQQHLAIKLRGLHLQLYQHILQHGLVLPSSLI